MAKLILEEVKGVVGRIGNFPLFNTLTWTIKRSAGSSGGNLNFAAKKENVVLTL